MIIIFVYAGKRSRIMIKRNAIKAHKDTEKQVWKQINTKINEAINSGNFYVTICISTKEVKSIVKVLENSGYTVEADIDESCGNSYIYICW